MKTSTYRTSQVAELIGIHANTVRFYEAQGLIPPAQRQANGYRVFTEFHIAQLRLARTAFQVEVLQNGLRQQAIQVIKTAARGQLDEALALAEAYRQAIRREQAQAEEALQLVRELLTGGPVSDDLTQPQPYLTRQATADLLGITIDTLRNWELNGLLRVKRRQNGYRVYTAADIRILKIIRSLRCANYSLSAILRLLQTLSHDPAADIRSVLDTPATDDDIISVYDQLLSSLRQAEANAGSLIRQLESMKRQF